MNVSVTLLKVSIDNAVNPRIFYLQDAQDISLLSYTILALHWWDSQKLIGPFKRAAIGHKTSIVAMKLRTKFLHFFNKTYRKSFIILW